MVGGGVVGGGVVGGGVVGGGVVGGGVVGGGVVGGGVVGGGVVTVAVEKRTHEYISSKILHQSKLPLFQFSNIAKNYNHLCMINFT